MSSIITVNVLASGSKSGAASSVAVTITAGARVCALGDFSGALSDSYGGASWQSLGGLQFKDFASGGAGTITWDSVTAPETEAYQILELVLGAGYAWGSGGGDTGGGEYSVIVGDKPSRSPISWTPGSTGENFALVAQTKQLTGIFGAQNYGADPPSASPGTPTGGGYAGGFYATSNYSAAPGKRHGYAWRAADDTSLSLTLPAINYSAPEAEGTYESYAWFKARPTALTQTLSWDTLPDGRRVVACCATTQLKVYRYSDALTPALELTLTGETSGVTQVSLQVRRSGVVDVVYTCAESVYLRSIRDLDTGLPTAVTIATGYQGSTHFLDEGSGMLVVPLYDSATSTWKYVVGALDSGGTTWSWSSVQTLVSSASGSGQIRRNRFGRWVFVYVTSGFAVAALSCQNLQPDGTGTWS